MLHHYAAISSSIVDIDALRFFCGINASLFGAPAAPASA